MYAEVVFLSRIMQKLLGRFSRNSLDGWHKLLDFGCNPDYATLELGLRLDGPETIGGGAGGMEGADAPHLQTGGGANGITSPHFADLET